MRRHTLIGESMLSAAPVLQPAARIVRSSHERYDGTGYPDGIRGSEIPLASRIVFVCDAFHAMTTDRPYGSARSVESALEELAKCAGSQFDPDVVAAFREELGYGPIRSPISSLKDQLPVQVPPSLPGEQPTSISIWYVPAPRNPPNESEPTVVRLKKGL